MVLVVLLAVAPWSLAGARFMEASGVAVGGIATILVYLLITLPALGGGMPLYCVAASPIVLLIGAASGVVAGGDIALERSLLNLSVAGLAWVWIPVASGLAGESTALSFGEVLLQARMLLIVVLFGTLMVVLTAPWYLFALASCGLAILGTYSNSWGTLACLSFMANSWIWHAHPFSSLDEDALRIGVWRTLQEAFVPIPLATAVVIGVAVRANASGVGRVEKVGRQSVAPESDG